MTADQATLQEASLPDEQATLGEYAADLSALTPAEREAYEDIRQGRFGPRAYARETERSPGTISNLLARAEAKLGDSNRGNA